MGKIIHLSINLSKVSYILLLCMLDFFEISDTEDSQIDNIASYIDASFFVNHISLSSF